MANVLKAGIFYFLGVFAAGFMLGALRTFLLAAHTGPVVATLIEIPLMLLFAWYFCGYLVQKLAVPPVIYDRLVMGFVAFASLMVAEVLTAYLLLGGRMTDFLLTFDLPENRIGLGAQIAVAIFPMIQIYAFSRPGR